MLINNNDVTHILKAVSIQDNHELAEIALFTGQKETRIEISTLIYDYSILDNDEQLKILANDIVNFLIQTKQIIKPDSI